MSGIISARAWGKVWAYRSTFLLGLLNTVETAIFAILLALVLGVIFGLMATSGKKILQVISRVYVEIMQNTPILLQLCFFYYALAFPVTALESCRQVLLHWAYIPEPIWLRWYVRASNPFPRDSLKRHSPRDSPMWSGCIISSFRKASRSFYRLW